MSVLQHLLATPPEHVLGFDVAKDKIALSIDGGDAELIDNEARAIAPA